MVNKNVTSISEYLKKLQEIMIDSKKYVFRGEVQNFESNSCTPNLFRDLNFQHSLMYEKNVLDKLRNDLVDDSNNSYLLTAIEAQHGGFPSRLLDVTFNSLIALHFAVTPHPNSNEDDVKKSEESDGVVYIIEVNNFVSPLLTSLSKIYDDMIDVKGDIKKYNPYLSNHYCFIDHYKKNKRISVQQGAFVLFFGNSFRPIHSKYIKKIIIDKSFKKDIRSELERFFYISNSFVYPEPIYTISDVIKHSSVNIEFDNDPKVMLEDVLQSILDQAEFLYFECVNEMMLCDKKDKAQMNKIFIDGFRKVECYLNECINDIELTLSFKDKNNVKDKDKNNYNAELNHHRSFILEELDIIDKKVQQKFLILQNEGGNIDVE